MDVVIYILRDPEHGVIRYVGKTLDLKKRLNEHVHDGSRSHKNSWVKSLLARGLKPLIEEVEVIRDSNDEDWPEAERFWISYLRSIGCNLCNGDDGGNSGKIPSIETRAKISAKLKGRKMPPGWGERISGFKLGKKLGPLSAETRAKMSRSHLGKKLSPEHIEAARLGQIGLKRGPHSEEAKRKIGAASRGRFWSEEKRKRQSELLKGKKHRPLTEAHKATLSEMMRSRPRGSSGRLESVNLINATNP